MEKEVDRSAWIIIDLVNDFVTGKFGSESAVQVASKTRSVMENSGDRLIRIFTLDTHIPNDPEFAVWGEHCLIGTRASELDPSLEHYDGYRIRKRRYDAFLETDLDAYLRANCVNTLYLSGVSTDICVMHTAAGAFFRYYRTAVIEDLCASIDSKSHSTAIELMKRLYGTRIIRSDEFLKEVA